MGFWVFMFACNLLAPTLMLVFGYVMRYYPPKQINAIYGYRTPMSTKNINTWNYAHAVCGKLWWRIGWWMLILSVVCQLPFIHSDTDTVGKLAAVLETVQCLFLIAPIFAVERALKKKFDKDGNER